MQIKLEHLYTPEGEIKVTAVAHDCSDGGVYQMSGLIVRTAIENAVDLHGLIRSVEIRVIARLLNGMPQGVH